MKLKYAKQHVTNIEVVESTDTWGNKVYVVQDKTFSNRIEAKLHRTDVMLEQLVELTKGIVKHEKH